MIADLIKAAAEMKRKTTMVESHSDHCPHCDFEFREKCYPVVKDKGVRVSSIDKVYKTGEYDEHCPECDGVLDQKERSDEDIDGDNWLAFPGFKEEAKARRETQRRRKAERSEYKCEHDINVPFNTCDYGCKKPMEKKAMVKQEGHEWILYTADGARVLGRHTSAKKAYAQEYAIKKSQESKLEKQALRPISERMQRLRDRRGECYTCGKPNRDGLVCDCGETKEWTRDEVMNKEASRTKELQELLDDSDIPSDIYFFTDGKERATVCIGDWHSDEEGDIAIQFGLANWDNFERPDDTEIGKPEWATMTLHPRRKGLSKKASIASLLRQARNATHEHPTDKQRRAGNYAKGTFKYKGLTIKIENPKDSIRRGTDNKGKKWESRLPADYGYFTGTEAVDGDAVDVFIGPNLESDMVVAIDQIIDGKYDETKFLVGITSQEQAEKLYLSAYQKGWKLGPVSTTTVQQLKNWLKDGDHKKPFKGQMVKAAAWWNKRKAVTPSDPTALKFLPKNVKDLLAVTFGSKWATKEEQRRKAK